MTSIQDPERPWLVRPETPAEARLRELEEQIARLKRQRDELKRPRRVWVAGYGIRLERPDVESPARPSIPCQ